ncbi:hypothetical protein QOT17_019662 [Balamuthia mandrillaris]
MMDNANHHYHWPYGDDEDGAQGSQPCQQMDLFCSSEEPLDVATWLSFFEDGGQAERRGLGSGGSSFSLDSFRQVEEEIAEELRRHHGKIDEEVYAFVAAEQTRKPLLPSQSCITTAYSEDDPPRREVTATPPPSLPLPLPTLSTTQEESGKEPVKQGEEEEEEEVEIVSVVHKNENSPSPFGLPVYHRLFQRTTPARQRPPLSLAKRTPNKVASSRIASSTSSFSRIGPLPPSSTISSCEASSSGPLSKVSLSTGKDVAKMEKPTPSLSTADTYAALTETTTSPKAAATPTPSSSPSPTKQRKRKKKQWGGFLDTSSSSSEEWEGEERAFSNGSSPVKEEDNTRQHVAALLPFNKTREEAADEECNGNQKERGNSLKRKMERVSNLLAEPSSPDAIATRHNSDNDDNMEHDNPVASQHKKRRIQVSEQDPMALVVQGHLSQDEKYEEEQKEEEPVEEVVTKRRRGRPKGSGKKRTSRGRPPKHRASVVEPSAQTEPPQKEGSKASNHRLTIRITRNSKRMEEDDLPSKSREEKNEAMTMQSSLTEEQQYNESSKKMHPAQEENDSREEGDEGNEEEFIKLDKFVEPFDEQSVKDWSSARIAAWRQRHSNPNAYYYRFTDIGVKQASGGIKGAEAKAWMDRYNEFKSKGWQVGSSWGLFSKGLPHRVGYQCANYYRKLVKERKLPNEKANAIASKRTDNEVDEETRQCSSGYRGGHSKDMQLKNCLTDVWQTQQVKYVEKWVDRWLGKYHGGEGDITFTASSVSPQRSKRETEHSTIAPQPISSVSLSGIDTSHVHKQEKKKSKDNEKENEKRTPLNTSKTNDALLLLERKEQRLATKANKKTELPLSPPQQPPKLEKKEIKSFQPECNKKKLISSSPLPRSKQTAPITRQLDLSFWIKGLAPLPQEDQPPEKVAMPKCIPSTWARLIHPLRRDHKGRTALQRRYEDIKGAL